MHDQVLLDFLAEMKGCSAGRADLTGIAAVQADDIAVIVDEGVCRVRDDEQLPPQAVDAEQILQELAEAGIAVAQELLVII